MRKSYVVLGVLMVFILLGLGMAGRWWKGVSGKVFVGDQTKVGIKKDTKSPVQIFFQDKKPLNILLLGYGGGNHDGANLTDSMIVAHLDPNMKRITLISIPRDIWVQIGNKAGKINSALQTGIDLGGVNEGGKLAKDAIASVSGLPIDYFVGINFDGFKNSIDKIGGVDIKVETTFDDPQYPIDGSENELCGHSQTELDQIAATASATTEPQLIFPCRYENLHFDAGMVHMDGTMALKYVRSRHSIQDGNDFGRSKRQKNLMVAVKQKVMSINFLSKLVPFVDSLGNNIQTDTSIEDARSLIQNAEALSKYQVTNLALTDDNYLTADFSDDGQYILVPKLGQSNFSEIKDWINEQLTALSPPTSAVVLVTNGTNVVGLAQKAVNNLKTQNVKTMIPSNAAEQAVQKTKITIYDENIDPKQLTILKTEFGVSSLTTAIDNNNLNFNVLVTLGLDYEK